MRGTSRTGPVVVVGAGIGGLAAALPLANAGADVTVLDRAAAPGGKMRQVDGVEAGPTVLTLRWVFDELFEAAGAQLDATLKLVPQSILARHYWPDGTRLDLHADPQRSAAEIRAFAGPRAERQFRAFSDRARLLFEEFLDPVMTAPAARPGRLVRHLLTRPELLRAMAPHRSLAGLLARSFDDMRLRQLFGRYATYVGGGPERVPALLALIWEAEAGGVWAVRGGMSALARAIADLIREKGGRLRMERHVEKILVGPDGVTGVTLDTGEVLPAAHVVFNGDPRALGLGLLGPGPVPAGAGVMRSPRALSARVWSFRARYDGPELAHHNVFFRDDPAPEFDALAKGRSAPRPTLYICAQDRFQDGPARRQERFEIIVNAPPLAPQSEDKEEFGECLSRTFGTLARFGVRLTPDPEPTHLTDPAGFETMFPGSAGSLYGQSPQGMTAAFRRPTARTEIPGLILAGGGVHPGPGVPMAALSGRHAAEAILEDRASTSTSRPTATRGGMSMA